MYLDILIYLVIAAFLFYRLNSVMGRRNDSAQEKPFDDVADDQPQRPSPASPAPPRAAAAPLPASYAAPAPHYSLDDIVDAAANADGRVEQGLADIASADHRFDPSAFMAGARKAFEFIVTSYARGDLGALKPLLSPKLFADFAAGVEARKQAGHTTELSIHRIKAAKLKEAHLGGLMAYATVMFEVEETTCTRDAGGQVVDGDPDSILTVQDVWTFTRDTRAADPNWMLIETGVVEPAA